MALDFNEIRWEDQAKVKEMFRLRDKKREQDDESEQDDDVKPKSKSKRTPKVVIHITSVTTADSSRG